MEPAWRVCRLPRQGALPCESMSAAKTLVAYDDPESNTSHGLRTSPKV